MKKESESPPFPLLAMSFISLGTLANSIVFTAPLPYVAFMMVDFHMADKVDKAGLITGMFMIGRAISAIPWGIAADRWGRKSCLFLSMSCLALFGSIFGFSRSYEMAIFCRFFAGLGNGYISAAKTSISEIVSSKEHEVKAFGYLNGALGLGLILGPVIGGLLSRPAVQYPNLFSSTGFWGYYPYLLPSIICSLVAALAAMGILIFVPETIANNKKNIYQKVELKEKTAAEEEEEEREEEAIEMISIAEADSEARNHIQDENSEEEKNNSTGSAATATTTAAAAAHLPASLHEMIYDKNIQFIFFSFMTFCFIGIFVDEAFSLWCVTSLKHGGLAWQAAEVGETLAAIGFGVVIFQICCYAWAMKTCFNAGLVDTYVRLLQLSSISLFLTPFISNGILRMIASSEDHPSSSPPHTRNNIILRVVMVLCWLGNRIPVIAGHSILSIIVNGSVDPSMCGTMNGVIMLAGSIGNGIGPIVGLALYSFAVHSAYGDDDNDNEDNSHDASMLPIDGRIVFIVGGILTLLLAWMVKRHIIVKNNN